MRRGRPRIWSVAVPLVAVSLLAASCSGGVPAGTGSTTANHYTPLPSEPATPSSQSADGGPTPAQGASPLGAHWDQSRITSFEPYLRSVSGSVTYYEATWCKLEPTQGLPRWGPLDKALESAQQLGITLYVKIRVGACWATGGPAQHVRGNADKTESAMPTDLGTYEAFVKSLVGRAEAKGVNEFAVENEVNSASYWSGTPQQYQALAEVASRTIRATAPGAVVADAGLSSTSYGYGIADRLLKAGEGAKAVEAYDTYFARRIGTRGDQIPRVTDVTQLKDVLASEQGQRNLAYLQAVRELAARKVVDVRQVHFYEKWDAIPALLDYLHAETPAGTPIEAWEVGSFWKGASATEDERVEEMVKSLALFLAGGVRRAVWLPLATSENNRHGEEIRYGLLDPDGTVRGTGEAMRLMVQASRGAKVVPVRSGPLQGVAFTRAGRTDLVVWSDAGPVTVQLGRGAMSALATTAGAGLRPTGAGHVSVGGQPQILSTSLPLSKAIG